MKDCIFCSVAATNTPHHEIILQDENHVAFLDISPAKKGHTLVIPRKHSDTPLDMPAQEYSELLLFARKTSNFLKEKVTCALMGMVVEGVSVPHTHIHLIPFSKGDKLAKLQNIDRTPEELKIIADEIRA